MAQNFSATISDWVKDVEGATEAVFKQSAQEILSEAQKPVGAGGNMPVDTGMLRGSLTVGRNTEPAVVGGVRSGEAYTMEIAPAQLGDVLHARWTAEYAKHVEEGARGRPARGFMRKAAQRWQTIVAEVEARLAARLGR